MRITLAVLVLILCGTSYAQGNGDRYLDVYAQFSSVKTDNLTATGGTNTSLAKGFDLGSAWTPCRR
jgi:hypothetical protein